MLFSYNWLQEFIKGKLPSPEKLGEVLALHAFEVDGIEKTSADSIFDVAILPQRGDCLSHYGLAREISAILGEELQEPETMPLKVEKGTFKPLKVSIAASAYVPRYSAAVIEGAKIGSSPQWMQERLEMLGVNSINSVVDITNYIILELGQPLHAFDYNKIQGQKMMFREAKEGERLMLLDETDLQLQKGVLIAQDARHIIDLAGIKGGKVSGIGSATTNIIFQAAAFDRQKIYHTKKSLGYSTSAADIYSHGIDPNLTVKALERAFFLLSKFGGGSVVQYIDIYPIKRKPRAVKFNLDVVEKLLGIAISKIESKTILERLGFEYIGSIVTVPTWRGDVSSQEDIVEEIGRIHGYEHIPAVFPEAFLAFPEKNMSLFWRETARDALKEAGFTEAYTYSFVSGDSQNEKKLVALENPISREFEYLRPNISANLLKAAEQNKKSVSSRDVRLFELGTAFTKTSKGVEERKKLAIVISSANGKAKDAFYEVKGAFEFMLSNFGITDVRYKEGENPLCAAKVYISQTKEVGTLQVGPEVVALEADFDTICEDALEEREYVPLSKYPALLRDIALLVPFQVKVEDALNIMEEAGGELVADIDLFDIYEGEELPNGKKNLAFHIVYQAKDRTLTNSEVDALQTKIVKALEENPEWEVRD